MEIQNIYKSAIWASLLKILAFTLNINEYIEEVEFHQNLELVDETSIDKDNLKFINLTSRDYHMTSPEIKKDIRILKEHLNIETLNPITHW